MMNQKAMNAMYEEINLCEFPATRESYYQMLPNPGSHWGRQGMTTDEHFEIKKQR